MPKTKVAVTLDSRLLREVDELVHQDRFPNRSQLVEAALVEKLARIRGTRLAIECAKLDRVEEVMLAEEGLSNDSEAWPEY
ncbi:MAG: ribbon-helix-helix domain-containing protein [Gemmatimonadaceae bacterium]|nr:ribbon-helix-helix domain-containing protein [Gemmatimonadaceae bacterium]